MNALEAVLASPIRRGRTLGALDAGHPVDQRAAADPGPGQHRHRAVPGRQQAVVEVVAVEGGEFGPWHRGLIGERPGLEDDDRSAGRGKGRRDDPAAGARTDDDRVRLEGDRRVRRRRSPPGARTGGSTSGGRSPAGRLADSRPPPGAHPDTPRPGRRRRGRSSACGRHRTPIAAARAASAPNQQVALARGRRHRGERPSRVRPAAGSPRANP